MIHVRGKRKRPKSATSQHDQHRRGRPPKALKDRASKCRPVIIEKLRQHHAAFQHKMSVEAGRLSALERLPVELIQQIFFYALECNMPRASPHLCQTLSTEQIFNALTIFAYFDDDGESPVEKKHFLPAEYRRLTCLEKIRLQRSIFSCRWGTYERIVSCMPALARLAMAQAWHTEHIEDESHSRGLDTPSDETAVVVANEAIRDIAALPTLDEESKLEQHYLARTTLQDPGSSSESTAGELRPYLPRIVTWNYKIDADGVVHKNTDRCLSVLACRHIPAKLLLGPSWSEQDLNLLRLLRQGYTFIQNDHVLSISAKALFEGMRQSIMRGNELVLKILLDMHNVFFKSGKLEHPKHAVNSINAGFTPSNPLDLFHLAAGHGNKATEMLSLLLRAGIDSLPQDDPVITAWAVRGKSQGNPLAEWLLRHMEGTANYGLPRRGHLFVDGCLSWRARPRGHLPFPETSFASELGYIPGTPIVPAGLNGKACGADDVESADVSDCGPAGIQQG